MGRQGWSRRSRQGLDLHKEILVNTSANKFREALSTPVPAGHLPPVVHSPIYIKACERMLPEEAQLFGCPDDLTILICVDAFSPETVLERNLRHLGIRYTLLRDGAGEPWHNTNKISIVREYLDHCVTKYVMCCDAFDVIFIKPAHTVLSKYLEFDCDLLFCATTFDGGYACMPHKRDWVHSVNGGRTRYLNGGVFIGERQFLKNFLDRAMVYVVDSPITMSRIVELGSGSGVDDRLCRHMKEFPRGVSSDQMIYRYIEPEYHPRVRVDYDGQLILRCL